MLLLENLSVYTYETYEVNHDFYVYVFIVNQIKTVPCGYSNRFSRYSLMSLRLIKVFPWNVKVFVALITPQL
jgi:hypothetical protein